MRERTKKETGMMTILGGEAPDVVRGEMKKIKYPKSGGVGVVA